jgi:hypothetical protein
MPRLALCVDRLATACRVVAPVWDQAPAQRVQRHLAGPVIAADDQEILAGCSVPPRRVYAAVAHVHAIDDGIPTRSAALDDPPAHRRDITIRQSSCQFMMPHHFSLAVY